MEPQKISREELYELVWKKPMTTVALEFSVSSVALAKTCRRLNIPHPGRGHWARLAAGQKLRKPSLPKATPEQNRWYIVRTHEPRAPGERPPRPVRPEVPNVAVSQSLQEAHGAVGRLGRLLRHASIDAHGRLVVAGAGEPVFAVTVEQHRRALLILDSFFKGLESRGHKVILDLKTEGDAPAVRITIAMKNASVDMNITERLEGREPSVIPSDDQVVQPGRRPQQRAPGEQCASGRLQLTVHTSGPRHSWSDGQAPLERNLGHIVVALETDAEKLRLRRELEERERLVAEERRKQEAVEAARRRETRRCRRK